MMLLQQHMHRCHSRSIHVYVKPATQFDGARAAHSVPQAYLWLRTRQAQQLRAVVSLFNAQEVATRCKVFSQIIVAQPCPRETLRAPREGRRAGRDGERHVLAASPVAPHPRLCVLTLAVRARCVPLLRAAV